jgi:hypothetical protein
MKTRRQKPIGMRKLGANLLARLAMVLLLSFALVQNAFADIYNDATASGTYQLVPVVSGDSFVSIPVVLNAPTIELLKSSTFNDESGDGFAQLGETITYAFSVQNTGNVTLTNVVVTDPTVTMSGGPIASLAPGATDTTTFTASYTLTAPDLLALLVTNSATTTASPPSGPAVTDVSDSQNPGDDTGADDDVTVTSFSVPIDAVNDDFSASPVNGLAGGNTATVFTNDTLNGAAFAPAAVTPTITAPGGLTGVTINASGTLTVPAATPAATYTVTYQICEVLNATNCDTANVTVVVTAATIVATDDDFSAVPISEVTGGTTATVYTNDTLNGVPFLTTDVTAIITDDDGITGLTIDSNGLLTIPASTPAATYTVTYRICENAIPLNCDPASVTIVVAPNPSVTGTVYYDVDGNGVFGGADFNAGAGYIVQLVDGGGVVVDSTTTNATGDYTLSNVPGTYSVMFRKPNLTAIGVITGVTLTLGQIVVDQDQPIDPSGVVYNSVTRLPVANVTVRITDAGGVALPLACLLDPTQQDQLTDATGQYFFDILPACALAETEFRISLLTVPAGYASGVSATLTPQPGPLDATTCPGDAVPGGSCQVSASATAPVTPSVVYYMAFLLISGDPDVVNNHIAIDPVSATSSGLYKRALVTQVRRGERVPYVITANDVSVSPARIVDIIPLGFDYVANSALVNGVAQEPVIAGRNLTFDPVPPYAGNDITIELTLIATVAVTTGPHVNTAQLIDPGTGLVVGTARATVTVLAEHVFDCGDIIGKVFDDRNRNGSQDEGEPGLAGVRLVTVKSVLITTDKHGRFHVACADVPDADIGSNFILKLDTRTLPSGFKMTTENPRIVRLTAGKTSKLNYGAAITRLVRFDMTEEAFAPGSVKLKAQWLRAVDKLISVLETDKSTLRLTYVSKTKDKKLAAERIAGVEKLILSRWAEQGGGYELLIETRVMGAK